MKLTAEAVRSEEEAQFGNRLALPQGLLGFDELREMELFYAPEQLPFLRLCDCGDSKIEFIVMEPQGLVGDYQVELSESDVAYLGLEGPEDALILNIVTVSREPAVRVTANLVGPIVVNRRTRVGRQVVLANHAEYSARHVLFDEKSSTQPEEES